MLVYSILMRNNKENNRLCGIIFSNSKIRKVGSEMKVDDRVRGVLNVDESLIQQVITTKAFQRLKGIKQLGNSYFFTNTATNNRFEHSIGVYENMKRIISVLECKGSIKLNDDIKMLAYVSALLHDIGHGPFSHAFETITNVHHETWTTNVIMEDKELNKLLDSDMKENVISIYKHRGKFPIIEELLFSQLGADKLDYHARDLSASKIDSVSFSIDDLISHLEWESGKLVIEASGVLFVEQYLHVRRTLFLQVFCHLNTVAKDILLKKVLLRAHQINELDIKKIDVDSFLSMNDDSIHYLIQGWKHSEDSILKQLSVLYMEPKETFRFQYEELTRKEFESINTHHVFEVLYKENPAYGFYKGGIRIYQQSDIYHFSSSIKEVMATKERYFKFTFI